MQDLIPDNSETVNGTQTFSNVRIIPDTYHQIRGYVEDKNSGISSKNLVINGFGSISQDDSNNATDATYSVELADVILNVTLQFAIGSTAHESLAGDFNGLLTAFGEGKVPAGSLKHMSTNI
jgi:hypothetical protein